MHCACTPTPPLKHNLGDYDATKTWVPTIIAILGTEVQNDPHKDKVKKTQWEKTPNRGYE